MIGIIGYHIKLAIHNPLGPVSTAACLQLNLASLSGRMDGFESGWIGC